MHCVHVTCVCVYACDVCVCVCVCVCVWVHVMCVYAGFMLLAAGDDELPECVAAARLSGRHIGSVEATDMSYFTALHVLDVSDSRVRYDTLR